MLLNQLALALFYVLFGPFLIIFDSSIEAASQLVTLDPTADLVAVFSVLRHGDRAPTDFYPLDPFSNASFWAPNGIGELNQLGIERMREAGRLYRARYQTFLERTGGWPRYVRSSTRNRTIESARYFLEGFLQQQQESPEVKITLDQRMLTTSYPCNRSNAAWLEWFQSAQVTGYMASKREDISFLGSLTGEDYFAAAPFTLRQLEFLATTTTIERDEYSLDVPAWIRNQSIIELMDDFKRHAYLFDWRPPTVQRYRVGPLLGDIRDNAQALIEESGNSSQRQTFFLYSTHDVNQVLLLQALGLYEQIGSWPTTYSSAIVFELYQSGKSTPLVRTLYRQVNTTSALFATFDLVDQPLNISACAQAAVQVQMILAGGGEHQKSSSSLEVLCPFEEFKALIKDKVPLNYEEECSRSSAAKLLKNALINSGGVVLALLLLLVSTVLL